ncbi:MAG: ArnT family glycosyltransferase [Flavobacteriales bacterium]
MIKALSQACLHTPVLLLFAVLKLLFLEADLSFFKHPEDFSDEFWWASAAIAKCQSGHYPTGAEAGPLFAGPLYSGLLWLWFKIFTPSLFSLRLLAWLAGTISVFLLYRLFTTWGKQQAFGVALTFSLVHSVFVYNRFAQVESLQLLLFLWMVLWLSKKESHNLIGAGVIAALALLLKFSFLPMTAAVVMYFFRGGSNRNAFKQVGIFLFPSLLFYLIYHIAFIANESRQASVYFGAFANSYYPLVDLLNPLSIPFRLMYLHQHTWFYDWSVLILFTIGALSLFVPKPPFKLSDDGRIHPLLILSGIYVLLLLFTDFNERRMILLLPGIAAIFIYGIPFRYHLLLKYVTFYVASLICMLQVVELLPYQEVRQAILKGPFHFRLIILHGKLFLLALHFRDRLPYLNTRKNDVGLLVVCAMLIVMLQFNFSGVLDMHPSFALLLFSLTIVTVIYLFLLKQGIKYIRFAWFGIALGMQVFVLAQSSFSVKEGLSEFSTLINDADYVAGDQVIYAACFNQPQKILAFTNSIQDNPEILLQQFEKHHPNIFIRLSHQIHGPISGAETIVLMSEKLGCSFRIIQGIPLLKNIHLQTVYTAEVFQVEYL